MRISDWSSDVCSSDLMLVGERHHEAIERLALQLIAKPSESGGISGHSGSSNWCWQASQVDPVDDLVGCLFTKDRKRDVEGTIVLVRGDIGACYILEQLQIVTTDICLYTQLLSIILIQNNS